MRQATFRPLEDASYIGHWLHRRVTNMSKKETGSSINDVTIKTFLNEFYHAKKHKAEYTPNDSTSEGNEQIDDYSDATLEKECFAKTAYDVMKAFKVFSFKGKDGKDRIELEELKKVLYLADPNLTEVRISQLLKDITEIMKRDENEEGDFIISDVIPELILGTLPPALQKK